MTNKKAFLWVLTIAVIPKGTTLDYWKAVHVGAEKAANEEKVKLIWKGPLKEDDREAQIGVMENLINLGVSGIALAPLDDAALRPVVHSAVQNKIPVVIFDSGIKSDDYVSFVATDNFKGGEIAGQEMIRLLGGKGKVIMLRCQEGSESTMQREKGFLSAIAKSPGIQVVSSNQYGGSLVENAYRVSENMLPPYLSKEGKLTIDGIFTSNESTTFGMLRALQEMKLAGHVKFVGFDRSDKLDQALKNGQLNATVIQNPESMGYLSVKTLVAHLKGQKTEKRIDTGVRLITQKN